MLNRRTIRIKIMQNLFAYAQCKEADLLLARDLIEERFRVDLNSMEVQDKELLRKKKKQALQFFDKHTSGSSPSIDDKEIEKAIEDAADLYQKSVKKDQVFLSKNILLEMGKLSATYHSVISLMIAFADLAASEKKSGHSNFANHSWIKSWRENDELKKSILKENAGWDNKMDHVRSWFRERVKEDTTYKEFVSEKAPSEESQKAFIKHLARKIILGAGAINDYFEEQNIRWAEDKDIIKSMVDKTINSFADGKTTLQKVSLNWDEDSEFTEKYSIIQLP